MALLKCRHCQTVIDSNARKTRCHGCGQLFPFACAICDAPLRPPFPVFDDERYLNADNVPLCADHFQRQCPQCEQWFSAHDNPGYFLCRSCMDAPREIESEPAFAPASTDAAIDIVTEAPSPVAAQPVTSTRTRPSINIIDALLSVIVFVSVIAVVVVLGWQIIATLRPLIGF